MAAVHTVHCAVPCAWCTAAACAKGSSAQSGVSQLFTCESLLKSEAVLASPVINVIRIACQVQIQHIPWKRALRACEWRETSISALERQRPWGGKNLGMQWQLYIASTSLWVRAETWTQEFKRHRKAEGKMVRSVIQFSTGLRECQPQVRMFVNGIIAEERFHWLRKWRSLKT